MVKKCINGHYYDGGRFTQCPYCGAADMTDNDNAPAVSAAAPVSPAQQAETQPVQQAVPQPVPQPTAAYNDDDDDATIPLAFYMKQKAQQAVPEQQEPVSISAPVQENPDVSYTETITDPQAQTLPEQKPEEPPVVTDDIAALVAEAISDDRPVELEATEQPTPEENAAANAFMEQEQLSQTDPVLRPAEDAQPVPPEDAQPVPEEAAQEYAYALLEAGWLVGIDGASKGKVLDLKAGGNILGSTDGNDVSVSGDGAAFAVKYGSIDYKPDTRAFLVTADGAAGQLTVNGEAVTGTKELAAYDRLTFGGGTFLFFPLCNEGFAWEDLDFQD